MKAFGLRFTLLFTLFLLPGIAFSQIIINEYSASNLKQFFDEYGDDGDWVELFNSSSADVNLKNWYLSDNENKPTKWQIKEDIWVSPGQSKVFWCSGRNTGVHTNFKLSQTKSNPESILVSNPQGVVKDKQILQRTQNRHSRGRSTDGAGAWSVFITPTPGASNNTQTAYKGYTKTPVLGMAAGFYTGPQSISISNQEPNSTLRFTTNGNEPKSSSAIYAQPLNVSQTTVIKAAAFSNDPLVLPGFMAYATYFIDESFGLVVVSVAAEQVVQLAEGQKELRPVGSIEYFGKDKQLKARSYGELNSHGQDSWVNDQRSLDWVSRDEMGYSGALEAKIFSARERDEYQRLILRAAGDDNYPDGSNTPGGGAHLRDAYIQNLAQRSGLHLDLRVGEKAIVFLNGRYWGVYDLREIPDDSDYTEFYYNQDKFNIQYLLTWGGTWAEYGGDQAFIDWQQTQDFILNNDMSVQANFDSAAAMLNVKSLTDYVLVQSGTVCSDWLNYNTGWWRGLNPEGDHKKWGFILWDNDATFGYYYNYTGIPNTNANASPCDVDELVESDSMYYPPYVEIAQETLEVNGTIFYPGDTIYFDPGGWFEVTADLNDHMRTLLKLRTNPEFNRYYITRYTDLMNTMFHCDTMLGYLASQYNLIKPEMTRHIQRWGGSMAGWETNYYKLRNFVAARCGLLNQGVQDCYDLTGPYTVTYDVDPPGEGKLEINSLKIDKFPFTAKYYGGIQNRVEANVVNPDKYAFESWETVNTNASGTSDVTMLEFNSAAQVIAHYKLLSSATNGPSFEGYAVKVQPTITSGAVELQYELPQADGVQIRVIQANGQVISDLQQNAAFVAGRFAMTLDLRAAGLPDGLYFIQFRTEKGFVETFKVVLQ